MRHARWVVAILFIVTLSITGCQTPYLLKSAFSQADLLMSRVPVDEALTDPSLSDEQKQKLRLAQEARTFAEKDLGLKKTKNYTSYVQLDRPYVTYVVSAAERYQLKPFNWRYPLLGALPYRGYFNEADAKAEADRLEKEGYDAMVRGVSAYSTLGWFRDPVLSSMLAYKDHDLVNTIIHETVHATLYIKSEADFNERLATYIGNKGTEIFYLGREGSASPTLEQIKKENDDDRAFSEFISREADALEKWYGARSGKVIPEPERRARLDEIQKRFATELRPKLSADSYKNFEKYPLNNARILNYKLYFQDLSEFERVFVKMGSDFGTFLKYCKSLEDKDDPQGELTAQAKP